MSVAIKERVRSVEHDTRSQDYSLGDESLAASERWASAFYSPNYDQLIHLEPAEAIGRGTVATAYNVESHQHLVLLDRTASNSDIENSRAKLDAYSRIEAGTKVPRILAVFERRGRLFEVMERAPGECVHMVDESHSEWSERLQKLANSPQHYYDELLVTLLNLRSAGLSVDTSNPENLFLEQKQGFYCIDLDLGDGCDPDSVVNLLVNCRGLSRARGSITPHDKVAIEEILAKMSKAGFELGETSAYVLNSIGHG